MATGTLSTKYLRVGQPDGYTGQNVVRSRLFRKTATVDGTINAGDTLASGEYVAAMKIPEGFIPSGVVVNVIKANASGDLSVYAAKNPTAMAYNTSSDVSFGSADLDAVGKTYLELVAGSTSSAVPDGGGTPTITTTSKRWLAGDNAYVYIAADAAVDAEFELLLLGDWATFGV